MYPAPAMRKGRGSAVRKALVVVLAVGGAVALCLYQARDQPKTSLWRPPICDVPKDSGHSGAVAAATGAGLVLALQVVYRLFRRWRAHHCDSAGEATLVRDLDTLLRYELAADVTLTAGGTQLKAHRAILVARSPVFATTMAFDCVEANSRHISVADVEPDVMKQLLVFLYTDRVQLDPLLAQKLLVAADTYQVESLKKRCEHFLSQNLRVENAATCAVLAVQHSCECLADSCAHFIAAHLKPVMDSKGWSQAIRNHPTDALLVSRLVAAASTKTRCTFRNIVLTLVMCGVLAAIMSAISSA